MILPDKYEDLNKSFIVLGYRVLKEVKKKDYPVMKLYEHINKTENIDILYFYDVLTFLWILDAIEINFNIIRYNDDINKNNN